MQSVLNSYGSVSHKSFVHVNADLLFRRSDGIGSYSAGRSQEYAYVRRLSARRLSLLLDLDNTYMLSSVSAAFYENRALFTIWPRLGTFNVSDSSGNPIATSQQVYFDAIAALDFYAQASMKGSCSAYDGEWDKWQFLQVFTSIISGATRCFAMVKLPNPFPLDSRLGTTPYSDSILGMCEIREHALDDGNGDRISCSIETRLMTFSDSFQFKNLFAGDLYIRDMIGKIDSTLYWKPDDYACYVLWGSWTGCADQFNCDYDPAQCFVPGAKWPGYLPRLRAPSPPQTTNPCTSLQLRRGFGFQFRLDWIGHMKIYQLGFLADANLEYSYAPAEFFKVIDIVPASPTENLLLHLQIAPLSPTDAGCYPATAQAFMNLIQTYGFAVFPIASSGQSTVNIGPNAPGPADVTAPWFNTPTNEWYYWNGSAWVIVTTDAVAGVDGGFFYGNYNYGYYSGNAFHYPAGYDPATINVQDYPWLRTNVDGTFDGIYTYNTPNTAWLSPITVQIGDIKMFATNDGPGLGWLDITPTYPGSVPIGIGAVPSDAPADRTITLLGTGGEGSHVITIPELASHGHELNQGQTGPTGDFAGSPSVYGTPYTAPTLDTGGDQGHNNLPPYFGVRYFQFTGVNCIIINNVAYRTYTQPLFPAT